MAVACFFIISGYVLALKPLSLIHAGEHLKLLDNLASAFFREGWQVQAFPSFGAERTGVPVSAFLRIDRTRITSHYHVYEPDHVVVLDPVLLETVNVTNGLREGGWILVNSAAPPGGSGRLLC